MYLNMYLVLDYVNEGLELDQLLNIDVLSAIMISC